MDVVYKPRPGMVDAMKGAKEVITPHECGTVTSRDVRSNSPRHTARCFCACFATTLL